MSAEKDEGLGMKLLKGFGQILLSMADEGAKQAMKSGDPQKMEAASRYMTTRQGIANKIQEQKQKEEMRKQKRK